MDLESGKVHSRIARHWGCHCLPSEPCDSAAPWERMWDTEHRIAVLIDCANALPEPAEHALAGPGPAPITADPMRPAGCARCRHAP